MSTVVVLLSDKRSGSTAFQRALCEHRDIAHVEYTPHANFETHFWLAAAVMLDMPADGYSGNVVYPGYGSARNAETLLVDCVTRNVPGFSSDAVGQQWVFEAWEALCERYQPVFFEKSPQHPAHWNALSLFLAWTQQTQRSIKVIGLTRNPLAVMYSAFKQFHTPPAERQYGWLAVQRNLLRCESQLGPQQFLHCRYEDFIDAPTSAFAQVLEFVGCTADGTLGQGVTTDARDKWRDDPAFSFDLDESVREMAHRFGYAEDALTNPHAGDRPTPQPSLRGRLELLKNRFINRWWKPRALRRKQG